MCLFLKDSPWQESAVARRQETEERWKRDRAETREQQRKDRGEREREREIYIYIYETYGECLEMRHTFPVCTSKEALLRRKKGCIRMWDRRENGDTDRHRQNEERKQRNGQREKPQWRDRDGEILD